MSIGPDAGPNPGPDAGREAPESMRSVHEALPMRVAEGWHAWLVPLLPLPIAPRQRAGWAEVVTALVNRMRDGRERSVFLELAELHKDNAIRQLSVHGRQWGPEIGLGMYPDRHPPRLWTYAALTEMSVNDPFPSGVLSVAHLDASEAGRKHAMETMCGTGGLLQVVHREPADQVMAGWNDVLQRTVDEPAMQAYPFYVPLLSGATIRNGTREQLERWLGGVGVYLRESPADQGLLMVSREPMEAAMDAAGIRWQ